MAIFCPKCGAKHDVVEFSAEGGSASGGEVPFVICHCGKRIGLSLMETVEDFLRYFENNEEREKAKEIQSDAEKICQMIVNDECSLVDIEIAKERLREKTEKLFPGKIETYKMIYEARFNRLWDQFRS